MQSKNLLLSVLLLVAGALAALSPGPVEAQVGGAPMRVVPYATNFGITVQSGNSADGFSPDVVPLNKRLVIEFISVFVQAQTGDKPSFYLRDSVNGHGRTYWIPLTLTDPGGTEVYRATQLVKLYYDGDGVSGPAVGCGRNFNSYTVMTCSVTLSGYLIDK